VLVPVLRLGHLRQGDLGVVAEHGEEVGRGEGRGFHHVERRQTTQPPARLRLRASSETSPHALRTHTATHCKNIGISTDIWWPIRCQ